MTTAPIVGELSNSKEDRLAVMNAVYAPSMSTPTFEASEFSFPTLAVPPRLAKIGRSLSQMSESFRLPDLADEPSSSKRPSLEETRAALTKGEEPLLCPYCNKALPPTLVKDQSRKKLLAPISVEAKSTPVSPRISAQELSTPVSKGDDAESLSSKSLILEAELQAWADKAGVRLDQSSKAASIDSQTERKTSTSSRFNFFRRTSSQNDQVPTKVNSKIDSKDGGSDDDIATGYAKLTAPGSDTDEEILHDEPEMMDSKGMPDAKDLKDLLHEVLGRLGVMVSGRRRNSCSCSVTSAIRPDDFARRSAHIVEDCQIKPRHGRSELRDAGRSTPSEYISIHETEPSGIQPQSEFLPQPKHYADRTSPKRFPSPGLRPV